MMKKLMKALMSSVLALAMVFSLPVASGAATGTFSVKVSGTNVLFIRGGKTTATYPMTSKDVTLLTDTEDDFLVSFLGKSSKRTYVSLGSQTTLSISGDMNVLTLDAKLDDDISVAIPSGTTVSSMKINNASRVNIRGKVGTLTVDDAGDVTVASGGSVTTATLNDSEAYLTASTGSSVKTVTAVSKSSVSGSGIGSVKTSGSSGSDSDSNSTDYNDDGIRLVIDSIDASSGDELDDLIYDLNDCVVAEDEDGDTVRGAVEWVSRGSTEVRNGGSYSFRFVPDSSRYDEITGKIKVYTDGSSGDDDDDDYDADYDLEIESIDVASGNKRLRDLTKYLTANVKAYDYDGKRINGRATWVDSTSTRVVRSDEYEFTFKPSSKNYDPVTDVIEINVDDDESFDDTGLKVIADDIRVSRSKKLGDLVDELNDAITAYDIDGETVTGSADWYDNSSTLVKTTGTYEFVFNPRGNYRSVRGECTITVGSSGGGSSNTNGNTDISLEIGEIELDDVTRLSELVDELNDEVVAYDSSGKKISGKCTWISGNASTKVRGTNEFQFEFKPSSSRYGKVKDYITIYLE